METVTKTFTQKTVDEVKEIKRKTRHDIELKKEELRQMVGERYRDLIEAADTISEMKTSAEDTVACVKDVKLFFSQSSFIKSSFAPWTKQLQKRKDHKRYLEIAAEAKVLMEMPEKIWSQVEGGNLTNASLLYLQSMSMLRNLSLDGSSAYSPVLQWFPMLGQQAQAVGNLRSAVLKQCEVQLRDFTARSAKQAEAVCSIVMLQKCSLHHALRTFLDTRHRVLDDILAGGNVAGVAYGTVGSKQCICDSVDCLVRTVTQVYDLFCGDGLISQLLRDYTSWSAQDCTARLYGNAASTEKWSKHLPSDTTSQLLKIDDSANLPADQIRGEATAWLDRSSTLLLSGVARLLTFTATCKDLAHIRDSAMSVLAASCRREEADDEEWMEEGASPRQRSDREWMTRCTEVFGREVDVWTEVLRGVFVAKIERLISATFERLLQQARHLLNQQPSASELKPSDISAFLWREHDDDIAADMAWEPWQQRRHRDLDTQGGLTLKTLTVTPAVRAACRVMDDTVRALLDDVGHYARVEPGPEPLFRRPVQPDTGKEGEGERAPIYAALKASCEEYLAAFDAICREQLDKLQSSDHAPDHALFLAFTCANMHRLAPSFRRCCFPDDHVDHRHHRALHRRVSSTQRHASSEWERVTSVTSSRARDFMRAWCARMLAARVADFARHLLASCETVHAGRSFAAWDVISIREEGEAGDVIDSEITVPAACSGFTQQLLADVCRQLAQVGAHALSRAWLRESAHRLMNGVLGAFSAARKRFAAADGNLHGQSVEDAATPSQTWALQALFDLRYLHALLHDPRGLKRDDDEDDGEDEDSEVFTYSELVDWLEGYVDPFDLDVFSPHVTRNIERHVTRTCVMFGILTSPEKLLSGGGVKFGGGGGGKDAHNVLPLAPDCGRFPLLPISTSTRGASSHPRGILKPQPPMPLSHALRGLTRADNLGESSPRPSLYSKLGQLSSSWLNMSSSYSED